MDLQQLKEENARIEAEQQAAAPQAGEVEEEEINAAEVVEEESEGLAEPEEEAETETEVESWMQSEAEDSQDSVEVDESAIWATARKKYKAKSEKEKQAHSEEIERLRQEMEELKANKSPAVIPAGKPKRDDFLDSDDPDEAYLDAMLEWRNGQNSKQQAQAEAEAKQKAIIDNINSSVDKHYERAAELANKNDIKPEIYQQSDAVVRNTIGEDVTNALIANMGEGSERVMFYLGRNPSRLAELKGVLTEDPSGLRAMMLLGKMSADSLPKKRKTMAPRPATNVKGDQKMGESHKALKKQYDAAHKAGNTQKAYDIKIKAKASGASTREW